MAGAKVLKGNPKKRRCNPVFQKLNFLMSEVNKTKQKNIVK